MTVGGRRIVLCLILVQLSMEQIKYTKIVSDFAEVSGAVLGDLTSILQFQAQTAFTELNSNPTQIVSIVDTLATDMAATIADLIQDLHQTGFNSPLEEAAQISGAVRTALEASLAISNNNLLSISDIIMIVNQLVGNIEDILRSTNADTTIDTLNQLLKQSLQSALYQGFGIMNESGPSPLFIRSPSITPTPTPVPTPTPILTPSQATLNLTRRTVASVATTERTYVFTSSGRRVLVGGCFDVVPPGGFTCEEQSKLGKCARGWMLQESFCAQTCGYCGDENNNNACIDIQPTKDVNCQEYKKQGECNSQLLVDNKFCRKTCDRCGANSGVSSTRIITPLPVPGIIVSPPSPPPVIQSDNCLDIQPDNQYTCEQQKQFGKCQAQWMIQGSFCTKTCERCGTTSVNTQIQPVSSECFDIAPDRKFTCEQQKQFGKCEAFWLVTGGFCRRTCNRCEGSLTPPPQTPPPPPPPPPPQQQQQQGDQQLAQQIAQLLSQAMERVLQDLGN